MAEVRKRETKTIYDSEKVKKKNNSQKITKVDNKNKKKEKVETKEKKGFLTSVRIFFNGVKSEFHKVHWTTKQKMVKYSIMTVLFIIFLSLFFYLIDVVFALIQSLLG